MGGSPAGRVAETALRDRAAADESPAGIKGVFPAVAGGVSRESEAKCVEESCEESYKESYKECVEKKSVEAKESHQEKSQEKP